MNLRNLPLALALSAAVSLASCAESLGQMLPPYWTLCRVTRVVDGDTYELLVNSQKVRVRLLNVDAPEMTQIYGSRATVLVKELLFVGRLVQLHVTATDLYGRKLGHIRLVPGGVAPQRLDSLLVARGWAWASGGPSAVPGGPWLSLHNSVSYEGSVVGLWKFHKPSACQYCNAVPPPIWRGFSRQTKNLYRYSQPPVAE